MKPLRILLVDDNRTNLELLRRLVDSLDCCSAVTFSSSVEVMSAAERLEFDIAVMDYQMPGYDGVQLMKKLLGLQKFQDKPMVIVTADTDLEIRMAALNAGAIDFLTKPVNPIEFIARMKNLVALTDARNKLADQATWLQTEVDKAVLKIREREEEIIDRLTLAAGYKDPETAKHTLRVAAYSEAIALSYGLSAEDAGEIRWAAPMHDIGKVAIADAVLLKQGKLTPDEFREMQRHSSVGYEILAGSRSKLLQLAAEIAGSHHERWDGAGYPRGLRGENIPLAARIVAVADTFDALTTARPYKDAWPLERAVEHVCDSAGTHFDPACISAFLKALSSIEKIMIDQHEPQLAWAAA
ncbi:HD domain-containing phosphohydrolase [Rhizobium sp. NPDC090275]|uniref:HD domain-containing phosphohydrolase n=1 Tax=Rhizobium sp. NPDC090275 TaxID=3364498 RepID=UPI00383BBD93